MTQLTLSWTTTVEEEHQTYIDTDHLPDVLRIAIGEGVSLDDTRLILDTGGHAIAAVHPERAQQIQDALDEFILMNDNSSTNVGESVTDRTIDSWEVE